MDRLDRCYFRTSRQGNGRRRLFFVITPHSADFRAMWHILPCSLIGAHLPICRSTIVLSPTHSLAVPDPCDPHLSKLQRMLVQQRTRLAADTLPPSPQSPHSCSRWHRRAYLPTLES